jgi:hypothetical protein
LLAVGVAVDHVEQHAAVVAAVDGGAEGADGVAADPAAEDDLHVVGAAKIEVVHEQRLEEAAGMPGRVEHDGAGDLDLAHGGLPPVAGVTVGVGERQGQPSQPALDEYADGAGTEPVADELQRVWILAGGEPVGELGEADTSLGGLALAHSWPLRQILPG